VYQRPLTYWVVINWGGIHKLAKECSAEEEEPFTPTWWGWQFFILLFAEKKWSSWGNCHLGNKRSAIEISVRPTQTIRRCISRGNCTHRERIPVPKAAMNKSRLDYHTVIYTCVQFRKAKESWCWESVFQNSMSHVTVTPADSDLQIRQMPRCRKTSLHQRQCVLNGKGWYMTQPWSGKVYACASLQQIWWVCVKSVLLSKQYNIPNLIMGSD
jgi:hypothetical protein